MLGVDTNVLIRYLTRDDKSRYEKARRLIDRELAKGEQVLVSLLVLLETEWVLRSRYDLAKEDIVTAFSALLDTADPAIENEPSVMLAATARIVAVSQRNLGSSSRSCIAL